MQTIVTIYELGKVIWLKILNHNYKLDIMQTIPYMNLVRPFNWDSDY